MEGQFTRSIPMPSSLRFLSLLAIAKHWSQARDGVHQTPNSLERSVKNFFFNQKALLVHAYEYYIFIPVTYYFHVKDELWFLREGEDDILRSALFPLPHLNKLATFHV